MSKIVKCVECNQNIEGTIVSAMGNTYHPEHFLCTICKEPIEDEKFYVKNGVPYCEKDYAELFLSKCYACQEPIKERVIKAMDRTYHEEHFICMSCNKPLVALSFVIMQGEPMCQKCYNINYADKCKGCGKPILDQVIMALNEKWHAACFKCCKCSKPVTEESFQVEGDRPLCSRCS